MNILLSSCTHWWNAEAHYAATLAECLLGAGHKAWVLTQPDTRNAEHLRQRNLPLVTDIPVWSRNPLAWPAAVRKLRAFQAREGVALVDVFRSGETPLHLLAARGTEVRVVRTRGSAHPIRGHALNRRIYGQSCAALIASANVLRDEMVRALRLPADAVRTIYFPSEPPVDVDEQTRRRERDALLAELGWAPERVMVGIVGRVSPVKGHDRLIEALARVRELHPQAGLVIVAKSHDDPPEHRRRLEAQVRRLGLGPHVRWLGFRADLPRVMRCLDVGVISSVASEMNCRVAMEFFAAGTAVVAFPTGALPEVIETDVTGVVTADRDPDTLAGVLGTLIARPELRGYLARHAREAARTRFSRERFLAETWEVYSRAARASR
jgi:glycosyltransferase involved in cell wall biosynthesis